MQELYSESSVVSYLTNIKAFRAKLLLLIHMAGGPPPRGTKILTIQYKNTINGEARGVFIKNSLVVYVTRYHKGIRTS
jgi:hypothetical protein